ncbi:MAG: hypothetical protein K2I42_07465, partial [Anaeroplasmataceae bacterium]|nr:hypothetical protein [Anaeroplasmataceae bacterium]
YKTDKKMLNLEEDKDNSIIFLDLSQKDIYQEFSNNSLLKQDIFDFIEKTYQFIKKNQKLQIQIQFSSDTSSEEKEKIKNLIHMHYAILFKKATFNIHKTNVIASIVLGIGALLFAVYGFMDWYKVNFIFQGIIEIFSWVFIWEACSLFTFTNSQNRLERFLWYKLYHAKLIEL